jgi:hypothetical protein
MDTVKPTPEECRAWLASLKERGLLLSDGGVLRGLYTAADYAFVARLHEVPLWFVRTVGSLRLRPRTHALLFVLPRALHRYMRRCEASYTAKVKDFI